MVLAELGTDADGDQGAVAVGLCPVAVKAAPGRPARLRALAHQAGETADPGPDPPVPLDLPVAQPLRSQADVEPAGLETKRRSTHGVGAAD